MASIMLKPSTMKKYAGWSYIEEGLFTLILAFLGLFYICAFICKIYIIKESLWSNIKAIYVNILGFLRYLRDPISFPPLQSICTMFSRRTAATQLEEVIAESNNRDERPPLPPKNRFILRGENPQPFQRLPDQIEPTPSTSGTHSDSGQAEADSRLLDHPQSSIQPALLPKSFKRNIQTSSSRKKFKQRIDDVINLKAIEEESGSSQDLSHFEINVSDLLSAAESSSSVLQETRFFIDSDPAESREKAMASDVKGFQRKQNIPEQTFAGYVGFTEFVKQTLGETKKQESPKISSEETAIRFSELQERERINYLEEIQRIPNTESLKQTLTAGYVPVSKLQSQEITPVREEKSMEQTTSRLLSAIQKAVGSTYVKRNKKNEKTLEEIGSSGLVSRLEQTSSLQSAGVERSENIQTASIDNSTASSQGAVSNEAEKGEIVFSLNLSGGGIVFSSSTSGTSLASDIDLSGTTVLDLSHIEVPTIWPENEAETREDN